jgi:hypothetical protein
MGKFAMRFEALRRGLYFAFVLLGTSYAVSVSHATTVVRIESLVGRGFTTETREFTSANAAFTLRCGAKTATVHIDSDTDWWLEFASPAHQALVADVYESANRYGFQSPRLPGLSISGNGSGCNTSTGRFVVRELVCSANNTIEKLAIDARDQCDFSGAASTFAYVRINSDIPLIVPQPTASAGNDQSVSEGDLVTLDGSNSVAQGAIARINWRQVAGPSVDLSNWQALSPTFVAPDVPMGGAVVTMELTIQNTAGLLDSNTVNVTVNDVNDPRRRVLVASDPGDLVGQGVRATLDESIYQFTGTCDERQATLRLDGGIFEQWSMSIAAPQGSALGEDVYDGAKRFPSYHPRYAALELRRGSQSCFNLRAAQFVVREFACAPDGRLDKLAVDIAQYCGTDDSSALRAYVRFNSAVPFVVPAPTASAGADQVVDAGQVVSLDASKSFAATAIAQYQWQQVGGPTVNLSSATAVKPVFTAPDVELAGANLVFAVTVVDANGAANTNQVTITVRNKNGPRTLLTMDSQPGDWIGGGTLERITDLDGIFRGTCGVNTVSVDVQYGGQLSLRFASSEDSVLIADVYEDATRFPFQSPRGNGLDISGNGRGCNGLQGRFVVREIQCSANNEIERLAIDAEQTCGTAPLRAYLRINSTIPEVVPHPTASAGADQEVEEGDTVSLDGSKSFAPDGIVNVTWVQTYGPALLLQDAATFRPRFVAPEVSPGGAIVTLQVEVTGTGGLTDRNWINVKIRDRASPRSLITIVSHPGDYIGNGVTSTETDFSARFNTFCNDAAASVNLDGNSWWRIALAAPMGSTLQTGISFENATRHPFQAASAPGLSVSGNGAGCNQLTGRFQVHEFSCNASGKVERLAVDVEQHCEHASRPPLFAFVRVNSAVPVPDDVDRGCRLDVDGDGTLDQRYDSGTLLRGLSGVAGTPLASGGSAPNAKRTSYWEFEHYLRSTCAVIPKSVGPTLCSLDLDGDGTVRLTTDGLMASRIIAGQTGNAVLINALGAEATRKSWTQLSDYMSTCKLLQTP